MFADDNLDDLDIGLGLEDLLSSRMGRSPFAFPFQGYGSYGSYGSLTKTESLTYFLC